MGSSLSKKHSKKSDRIKACEFAAMVMSRRENPLNPTIWSVTVFFEDYISRGAKGTYKNFGPKKPVKLKLK
jgi:hypothetical protein